MRCAPRTALAGYVAWTTEIAEYACASEREVRRDRARYVRTGNAARGGWPIKLAALLLGCWSPKRCRKVTVRIVEVAGVDAERRVWAGAVSVPPAACASRSNSSTSICDAPGIQLLNSIELGARDTTCDRAPGRPSVEAVGAGIRPPSRVTGSGSWSAIHRR